MFSARQTRTDEDRFTWIQASGYAVIAALVVLWVMSFVNGPSFHAASQPTAAVSGASRHTTAGNVGAGTQLAMAGTPSGSATAGGLAAASAATPADTSATGSGATRSSNSSASGTDTSQTVATGTQGSQSDTTAHSSGASHVADRSAAIPTPRAKGSTAHAVSVASSKKAISAAADGQGALATPEIPSTPQGSTSAGLTATQEIPSTPQGSTSAGLTATQEIPSTPSDSTSTTLAASHPAAAVSGTVSASNGTSSPSSTTAPASPDTTGSGSATPASGSSSTSPTDAAAISAVGDAAPTGPDGTWIVPPVPGGVDALGNQLPGLPGVATGPAPAGNVLAMGSPGDQYAFDVTNRTWILTPANGYKYVPGTGYVSTAGATDPAPDPKSLPIVDPSVTPGPDGGWIVPPVEGGLDANGTNLPSLPGVATGPAPAGNVLALGPDGSEYAFDVTNRTWILAANANATYKNGTGYVATGS